MKNSDLEKRLEELIEPILREKGLVLVDLELKGAGPKKILRVFIDRPNKGVTIRDCEEVSKEYSLVLDIEDPIEGSYILEISSPGIDRVLKKEREFRWALGKEVLVITQKETIRGTLEGFDEKIFLVKTKGDLREILREETLLIRLGG